MVNGCERAGSNFFPRNRARRRFITLTMAATALSVVGWGALLVGPAWAIDGRVEINQAGALAGGITPGDAPGFPVQITVSGSYILTSNLTVPDVNTDAVDISATGGTVGVDLNSFTIEAPGGCDAACPVTSCSTGTGSGVTTSATVFGISLEDGGIRGFGSHGVEVTGAVRLDDVFLYGNGGDGLNVSGGAARMVDVTPASNGGNGVLVDFQFPTTARSSIASCNGLDGFNIGLATRLVDCGSLANQGDGVQLGNDGIVTGGRFTSNRGFGLNCSGASGYSGNAISFNNLLGSGIEVSASCVELGPNLCAGNTTCP